MEPILFCAGYGALRWRRPGSVRSFECAGQLGRKGNRTDVSHRDRQPISRAQSTALPLSEAGPLQGPGRYPGREKLRMPLTCRLMRSRFRPMKRTKKRIVRYLTGLTLFCLALFPATSAKTPKPSQRDIEINVSQA